MRRFAGFCCALALMALAHGTGAQSIVPRVDGIKFGLGGASLPFYPAGSSVAAAILGSNGQFGANSFSALQGGTVLSLQGNTAYPSLYMDPGNLAVRLPGTFFVQDLGQATALQAGDAGVIASDATTGLQAWMTGRGAGDFHFSNQAFVNQFGGGHFNSNGGGCQSQAVALFAGAGAIDASGMHYTGLGVPAGTGTPRFGYAGFDGGCDTNPNGLLAGYGAMDGGGLSLGYDFFGAPLALTAPTTTANSITLPVGPAAPTAGQLGMVQRGTYVLTNAVDGSGRLYGAIASGPPSGSQIPIFGWVALGGNAGPVSALPTTYAAGSPSQLTVLIGMPDSFFAMNVGCTLEATFPMWALHAGTCGEFDVINNAGSAHANQITGPSVVGMDGPYNNGFEIGGLPLTTVGGGGWAMPNHGILVDGYNNYGVFINQVPGGAGVPLQINLSGGCGPEPVANDQTVAAGATTIPLPANAVGVVAGVPVQVIGDTANADIPAGTTVTAVGSDAQGDVVITLSHPVTVQLNGGTPIILGNYSAGTCLQQPAIGNPFVISDQLGNLATILRNGNLTTRGSSTAASFAASAGGNVLSLQAAGVSNGPLIYMDNANLTLKAPGATGAIYIQSTDGSGKTPPLVAGAATFSGDVGTPGILLAKQTSAPSAPGAGNAVVFAVPGTTSGTCKLQALAGTSATPVTIADNVGSGC